VFDRFKTHNLTFLEFLIGYRSLKCTVAYIVRLVRSIATKNGNLRTYHFTAFEGLIQTRQTSPGQLTRWWAFVRDIQLPYMLGRGWIPKSNSPESILAILADPSRRWSKPISAARFPVERQSKCSRSLLSLAPNRHHRGRRSLFWSSMGASRSWWMWVGMTRSIPLT
jgi:hypothetical protein